MPNLGLPFVPDAWRPWALRIVGSLLLLALFWLSPLWTSMSRLEHDLLSSLSAPARPDVGVLLVGIDEPSLAALHLAQTAEDDGALEQAMQGRMPVVLASTDVVVRNSQVAHYQQRGLSVFPSARHGAVGMPVDDDGVVRAAPGRDDALWRVLAQAAGRQIVPPPPGALLRHYAHEVPLPYAHYTQALDPLHALPPGALRGKLVLLAQNTPVGGEDQFVTPLHALGGGAQSGGMLHTTALLNGLIPFRVQ